jgi:hypothetical protein
MEHVAEHFIEALDPEWPAERVDVALTALAKAVNQRRDDLLDSLAVAIARRFEGGSLPYDAAMGKVAALYDTSAAKLEVRSSLYEVYWALDEGEYGAQGADRKNMPQRVGAERVCEPSLPESQRHDA